MIQARRDLDLVEEAVRPDRLGELGSQDLDRDLTVVLQVAGEIDVAMPPLPISRSIA